MIKKYLNYKIIGIMACSLIIAFGIGYYVSSAPSATTIGDNIEAKGTVCDGAGNCLNEVGGDVRVWQNMGPSIYQDNRDHSTSCDSGYLMSGVRVHVTNAVDGFMTAQCTQSGFSLSGSTVKGPLGNLD
ncbi:hypothetical protein KKA24_00340, partial [Patescibacteria group bacterium]|nr:hypothetical protein [Patescibacteria group bacterium]